MSLGDLRPHRRERKGNDERNASGPPDISDHAFWSLYVHLYLQNAPHLCSCTFPAIIQPPADGRVQRCRVHYGGFCLEIWPELHPRVSALIQKAKTTLSTPELSCCLRAKSDEMFLRYCSNVTMIALARGKRGFRETHTFFLFFLLIHSRLLSSSLVKQPSSPSK